MTVKYLTSYENSTEYKQYDYCDACDIYDLTWSRDGKYLSTKQRAEVMSSPKQRTYEVEEKHPNKLYDLLGFKLSKKVKELWRETDTVERSYFDNGTMISKSNKTTRVF